MGADGTIWTKTYTNNITTSINFYDVVGNSNSTGIVIDRIDTNKPSVTNITYTPSTATSGDVEVTITTNKPIWEPVGRTGAGTTRTKVYTANGDESFTITDAVGNTGEVEVHINRIDKEAPEATSVTYSPNTNTNGSVTVTLTTNEPVQFIPGRTGGPTTWTKIYTANTTEQVIFYDLVGNE